MRAEHIYHFSIDEIHQMLNNLCELGCAQMQWMNFDNVLELYMPAFVSKVGVCVCSEALLYRSISLIHEYLKMKKQNKKYWRCMNCLQSSIMSLFCINNVDRKRILFGCIPRASQCLRMLFFLFFLCHIAPMLCQLAIARV